MRYSVQPRDRVFVNGYRFLSFTKNMVKNISKNTTGKYRNLIGKYSLKLLDHSCGYCCSKSRCNIPSN